MKRKENKMVKLTLRELCELERLVVQEMDNADEGDYIFDKSFIKEFKTIQKKLNLLKKGV